MIFAGNAPPIQTIHLILYLDDKKLPIFVETIQQFKFFRSIAERKAVQHGGRPATTPPPDIDTLTVGLHIGEAERNMVRSFDAAATKDLTKLSHVQIKVNLINHCPFPAVERLPRLETLVHLCVKHGQLQSSTVSVERSLGLELLSASDENGETIMIYSRKHKSLVVKGEVRRHRVRSCGDEAVGRSHMYRSIPFEQHVVSNMALAALVMAVIAFQNTVNPAGGRWQEDTPFHKAGDVVIASTRPDLYKYLMLTNMVALCSALLTIFLIATGWPSRNIRLRWIVKSAMRVSIIAIAVSYVGSTVAIAPNTKIKSVNPIVLIVVMLVSIGITLAVSAFHL